MEKIFQNPHYFFWISIPFILLIGLIEDEIVVNVHDTYYVSGSLPLAIILSFGFAVVGFIYWRLIRNGFPPIRWMTITHMISSIDIPIIVWLIMFFDWFDSNSGSMVYRLSNQEFIISFLILLIIIGQLIFILNIFLTTLFQKRQPRN